jgi:hypothetical protein
MNNNLNMKKSIKVFTRLATAGTAVVLAQNGQSGQLIATGNLYQDAAPNYTFVNYDAGNSEEGNQVILAGSAAFDLITSFSFQFNYSGSLPVASAMADVKFYANNGTPVNGYASPGGVLFNSGPFLIGPYTTGSTANFYGSLDGFTGTGSGIVGGGTGVMVPQDFTWTVTFSGLQPGENAGLAIYSPIQVGADGLPNSDGWVNLGMGLVPANDSGNPLTFGAVFNGNTVVPDSSSLSISVVSVLAGFGCMKRFLRRA